MLSKNAVLALYRTHRCAVDAFRTIVTAPVKHPALSVIGKPTAWQPVDCYDTDCRARLLAQIHDHDFWSLWNVVWVPGLGTVLGNGPMITDLLREPGDSHAATVMGAVLWRMGVPEGSVLRYEMALLEHRSIVVAQGSRYEVEGVGEILGRSDALEVAIHAG